MSDMPSVSVSDGLRTVLDRMADGVFAVDSDWRIVYANGAARELLRSAIDDDDLESADTIDGVHLWEAIPRAVDTEFYDRYHEAMDTQTSVSFDSYYEPLDTWLDMRVFPSESGLSVYLRDITEQRRLEQRRRESLNAIQRLYVVSSDGELGFDEKLEAIFDLGREYLEIPNAFLTRIEDGTQRIESASADHPALQPGESCPLDEAYCKQTIDLDRPLTVVDASDEGWAGEPAYERFGLGTYIGRRIEVDGELYGTLCFADRDTRDEPFTDTQRTFVELLTRWISYELERQRAKSQLQHERDRLDEFASVVSHDLRNPLNTAMGRAELLAEGTDSQHLPPIRRALVRMETLIEDVLSLARDGARVEELTEVDIVGLVDEAWETSKTAEATVTVDADRLRVRADESRLRQLFENLFRNSVEHGGGSVTVTVDRLSGGNGFYLADDGSGMSEAERERVFETGYTTTDRGTGFGLSIVEGIVTAHDWEVAVTESADGGARFGVTGVSFVEE